MAVYMVRAGAYGPVKIGSTSATGYAGRIVKMQVDNHEKLTVIRLLDGDRSLESALHKRFIGLRLRGEWFIFDEAMLGDLGVSDWQPPPPPPGNPNSQSQCWTPERRATQSAKIRAAYGDPIKGPLRLARFQATMERKRIRAAAKRSAA